MNSGNLNLPNNSDVSFEDCKRTSTIKAVLQRCAPASLKYLVSLRLKRNRQEYALCADALDVDFYIRQVTDLWKAANNPVLHFNLYGWRRGLDPNPFFHTSWYLTQYEDARREKMNPLLHFLSCGWKEHRNPSLDFETLWYLQRNVDVARAGVNPLLHFLKHGRSEGRNPRPSAAMKEVAEESFVAIHNNDTSSSTEPELLTLPRFESNKVLDQVGNHLWRSNGNDPQFTLEKHVPAGFLRLHIEATCTNIRLLAAREAITEIFFDQGQGLSQADAFSFPLRGDNIEVNALVFLENDSNFIRFDPINTECEISFRVFSVNRVAISDAIRDLYHRYCWNGDKCLHSEREFLERVEWANISQFVREQADVIDHCMDPYRRWIEARRMSPAKIRQLYGAVQPKATTPLFSILMPTYKSDRTFLKRAIDSVKAQTDARWELCIVDDGSRDVGLHEFLEQQARNESRISYRRLSNNIGIAAASNEALLMARGEFVALLDHDDELALHALSAMAAAIEQTPIADMLYSDEDKIDNDGVRSGPFFKPDWSPEFFLSCMYTCHLGVYRRSLVEAVGGFRTAFNLAQDYDLAFRVSVKARAIVHVPDVLYHWRTLPTSTASGHEAKPAAELAARRAVQAHVDAEGLAGHVKPGPIPGTHRVKLELLGEPLITIVIPTAARRLEPGTPRWYILDLLRSIHDRSTYRNYEIILIDNGDVEPALQEQLRDFDVVTVTYREPIFNMSEKVNFGVAAARGEFIVLLNDDMTIITPDWLEELVAWLQRPGIVGVGGKLLFPDGRVQHAGILMLAQGPSHVYYGAADVDAGLVGSALTIRNYSAVTGACLAVRKADYEAVGGFDPALRINYNDVDFCLRLGRLGRIVYTAFAKLYHYESVSKGEIIASELGCFKQRWANILGMDPSYNINCSQTAPNAVSLRPIER